MLTAGAATAGFACSTYFFNRPHAGKDGRVLDVTAGHLLGLGTGAAILPAQIWLWRKAPRTRFAALHMGGIGAVSVLYHGWRMLDPTWGQ